MGSPATGPLPFAALATRRLIFSGCYFSISNPNPLDYGFSFARIISSENNNSNDKYLPQHSALPAPRN